MPLLLLLILRMLPLPPQVALLGIMSLCGLGAPLLIVPAMPDMLAGLSAAGAGGGDGEEGRELQPRRRAGGERSESVLDESSSEEDDNDEAAALVASRGARSPAEGDGGKASARDFARDEACSRAMARTSAKDAEAAAEARPACCVFNETA